MENAIFAKFTNIFRVPYVWICIWLMRIQILLYFWQIDTLKYSVFSAVERCTTPPRHVEDPLLLLDSLGHCYSQRCPSPPPHPHTDSSQPTSPTHFCFGLCGRTGKFFSLKNLKFACFFEILVGNKLFQCFISVIFLIFLFTYLKNNHLFLFLIII